MSSSSFINLIRKIQAQSVIKQMKGQSLPDGVSVFSDIHYLHDNTVNHSLDVYYPEHVEGLLPIVISIHGGAFVAGDKFYNKEFGMRLALQNFCVININYDLAPEVDLIDMVQSVNQALIWVYRHGKEYHGDIKQIYGLGDSAGGWQVITYSIVNNNKYLRAKYNFLLENPIKFNALALICPVANVKKAMDKNSRIKWFRNAVYNNGENGDDYKLTSIQDIIRYSQLPPTLIVTTKNDHYYYQSIELVDLYNQYKYPYQLLDVKDVSNKLDHCFNIMHPLFEESIKTNETIAEFFIRNR